MVTLAVGLLASWSHAQNRIVFVTSETTDGSIQDSGSSNTGIQGADDICNRLAALATPPLDTTNGTYKAWLSTSTTSPSTTFTQATVPYVRTDGTQIAADWTNLTDGGLDAPINRDESGNNPGADSFVWTGTTTSGTPAGQNCANWTSATGSGGIGQWIQANAQWTQIGTGECFLPFRFYCFQQGPPDHFLSYQIKKSKGVPKFEKREVFLADRFGEGDFEVKKPVALLNPADKNGEGITDPNTHLISYRVKGPKFEKLEDVPVEDQFGQLLLDVKRPDRLLVPASKNLSSLPDPPIIGAINLDHFLCYPVKESKRPQGDDDDDDDDDDGGSHLPVQAFVVDQFNQPKVFDVRRPTRLCNSVNKEGEGIKNPNSQLLCYQVKPARGEPRHQRIKNIFVHDQFGPKQMDTKKERELCVPAGPPEKTVLSTSRFNGNLGGVAGADAKCQGAAQAAGLSGTYLAWIADGDPTSAPSFRFTRNPGIYRRTDGAVVALDYTDLTDGSILNPIERDAFGNPL